MAKTTEELLEIREAAIKTIRQMQLRCMIIDAGIVGNPEMLREVMSDPELAVKFSRDWTPELMGKVELN